LFLRRKIWNTSCANNTRDGYLVSTRIFTEIPKPPASRTLIVTAHVTRDRVLRRFLNASALVAAAGVSSGATGASCGNQWRGYEEYRHQC
jgi:hypothetical protein